MNRIVLGAVGIALLVGCESTITGNEGNFQFSYVTDDRFTDFNKPIAVGAFLNLEVEDVVVQQPVQLSSAAFVDPSILEVVSVTDNNIVVQGMGVGNTLLEVEGTTTNGSVLTDSVNLLARVPEVLKIWNSCGDNAADQAGLYLTGQRIWVPWEMEMTNRQPVIGYGYYPVAVDGTAVVFHETDSNQQWFAFDTSTEVGTATLTSDIDDTTLAVEIVAEASIDGVAEPVAFVLEDIDVGDVNGFSTLPTMGGVPICQAEVTKTVVSDTPDICDVRDVEPTSSEERGWFEVEGLAAGDCLYTVTYPGGADGAGASAQFSFEIQL